MRRWDPINARQLDLLTRIVDGQDIDFAGGGRAMTLYALRDRDLVHARREGGDSPIDVGAADPGPHRGRFTT